SALEGSPSPSASTMEVRHRSATSSHIADAHGEVPAAHRPPTQLSVPLQNAWSSHAASVAQEAPASPGSPASDGAVQPMPDRQTSPPAQSLSALHGRWLAGAGSHPGPTTNAADSDC